MTATHNLLWSFEVHNAHGGVKRVDCSKPFNPAEWDDPRDAAIFFTFDSKDALAAEGLHIGKPATIRVDGARALSDTGF